MGNRVLSEAAGMIPKSRISDSEDTIMGNAADGHTNGGGYDGYHDENLYNPTRYTQTYFPNPQELTSPISDTTSYPLTDSEVDSDLAKVIDPIDNGIATTMELSKIQHLLSKIKIEDYHKKEQVVTPVEEEEMKPRGCTTVEDIELVECKTQEVLGPNENTIPKVIETMGSNSPKAGGSKECNVTEEAAKAIAGLNEITNSAGWVLIGIIEPVEGTLAEPIKQSGLKNAEVTRLADYDLSEANGAASYGSVVDVTTQAEDCVSEVTEPTACKAPKGLGKVDSHSDCGTTKPAEFKAEVEVADQDKRIESINPVQFYSAGARNEAFDKSYQNAEPDVEQDLSENDETTIFASEKMLEKLRARIIQEYKERIKDCEAELQEREAALRDQKLISQKKQDCLENYMNITERLTAEVSGLNKSLDQEKNRASQVIKNEYETANALAMTQEALQNTQILLDVERRKVGDTARKQYDTANELDLVTSSYDCLQARVEQEEANARAATRKEHETAKQLKIMTESFKSIKARMEKEEAKAKRLVKKESETAKQLKLITESFKTIQAQAIEDKKRAEQAIKKESDTAKQLIIMTESLKEMRAHSDRDKKKIEKATKKESDTAKKLEATMEILKEMQANVEKERTKTKNAAEKEADTAKQLEAMKESLKEVRASADEEKKKAKSEITRVKKMNKALEKAAIEKESKITKELEGLKGSIKEMQAFIDEEERKAEKAAEREVDTSLQLEVMKQSLKQHVFSIAALVSEKTEMQRIIGEIAQQNSFLKAKEEADNELLKSCYKIVRNLKDCFKSFLPRPESNAAIVKMPVSIVIMANTNIKQLKKLMQTNESIEYEQALARKEKSDAIDSTILKMDTEKMSRDLALWNAKCKEFEANAALRGRVISKKSITAVYGTMGNPPAVLRADATKKDGDLRGQAQSTRRSDGGGVRGGGKVKGRGKRVAIADVFDFTNGIPEDVNLEDGMRTLLGRVSPNFGECNNQQPK